MKLDSNVGNLDMIIRVAAGLLLVMLMAVGQIGAWGLVGIVLIVTGVARWCPAYRIFGWSTAKKTKHHAQGPTTS